MRTGDPAPLLSAAASGCAELPLRTLGTEQVHGERGAFGVVRSDGQQCPPAAHFTLADPTALRTSKRPGHVCPVLFDRNCPAPRCPKNLGAPTPQLGARAEDSPAPAACKPQSRRAPIIARSPRDLRRSEGQPGIGGGPHPLERALAGARPSSSQETDPLSPSSPSRLLGAGPPLPSQPSSCGLSSERERERERETQLSPFSPAWGAFLRTPLSVTQSPWGRWAVDPFA
jgi:hypothetical protein